jgi:hypothetical protein
MTVVSFPRSGDGLDWVNPPQNAAEVAVLRERIERGAPHGSQSQQHATARRWELEAGLHPRGRPRQTEKALNLPCVLLARQ